MSKILHNTSSSKATGLDEIPAKYLKDGSSVISKLLTHIINLSITTGSTRRVPVQRAVERDEIPYP